MRQNDLDGVLIVHRGQAAILGCRTRPDPLDLLDHISRIKGPAFRPMHVRGGDGKAL